MLTFLIPLVISVSLSFSAAAAGGGAQAQAPALKWYKGNTHAHTLNSDGDSTPEDLVRWYREQRYHFLVISDHNFITPIDVLNAAFGASERFMLIRGEEVSDRSGDKPIHLNGLNIPAGVAGIGAHGGTTPADVLQRNVDAIRKAGAVPQVNHPNFGWALTAGDLEAIRDCRLFELYNGHPQVNNNGGGGAPGTEEMWDAVLTKGHTLYAMATDDTHELKRPWTLAASRPGRGWVMVRAARLTAEDIVSALERGDFYATTGVELKDLQVTPRSLTVVAKESGATKFRVQFIGSGGRLLKEVAGASASYEFAGHEGYVRAKILDSNGLVAWTQPVRVN